MSFPDDYRCARVRNSITGEIVELERWMQYCTDYDFQVSSDGVFWATSWDRTVTDQTPRPFSRESHREKP